jgi:GTPase SAR1 family protein
MPMYFQGAEAAIVVYSITDSETLRGAREWFKELRYQLKTQPWIWLIGNKLDLEVDQRRVAITDAMQLAEQYGARYIETSALTGQNIGELVMEVADALLEKNTPETPSQTTTASPLPKNRCCC